jgi:hypothetical protein
MPDIKSDLLDVWYRRAEQVSPVRIRTLNRNRLVEHFGEHGLTRGAEVGVFRGRFSEFMLKHVEGSRVLCVDPWTFRQRGESCYESTRRRVEKYNEGELMTVTLCRECGRPFEYTAALSYRAGLKCHECDRQWWEDQDEWSFSYRTHAVQELRRRLDTGRPEGERAVLLRMTSMDAVRYVRDGSLDFVYIDGDHRFDYVMSDLIWWAQKVRYGGIISGHDYYRFRKAGVVPAVDAYTRQHGVAAWFLTDERTPSFFWVREKAVVDQGEELEEPGGAE